MERSWIFYSVNFLGKTHNSSQVLNGANHTLKVAPTILQSSVCASNERDKFQTNADIPSEDMNFIFFRDIRLPSKYLMAPLNSRFQPFKVDFFFFFFLGNEYTSSYFPDFVNRVDWGLLQTIPEMEKKFFLVEGFGGLQCNLSNCLCDSNTGLVCLSLLSIYRKPKA